MATQYNMIQFQHSTLVSIVAHSVLGKSFSNVNTIQHQELLWPIESNVLIILRGVITVATSFSILFTVNKLIKIVGNTCIWLITEWSNYCHYKTHNLQL